MAPKMGFFLFQIVGLHHWKDRTPQLSNLTMFVFLHEDKGKEARGLDSRIASSIIIRHDKAQRNLV